MQVQNKLKAERLTTPIFLFTFFSVMGLLMYYTVSLIAALTFFAIGSTIFFLICYQLYAKSPRYVEIEDEGATLFFLSGRTKYIHWEDIQVFYYEPGNPSKRGEARIGGGHFCLDGELPACILEKDAAYQMREQCRKKTGRYPPMKFNERKK